MIFVRAKNLICVLQLNTIHYSITNRQLLTCINMQVTPVDSNHQAISDDYFVRTGLLGFLGPVSLALLYK